MYIYIFQFAIQLNFILLSEYKKNKQNPNKQTKIINTIQWKPQLKLDWKGLNLQIKSIRITNGYNNP